ncbi:hypothetical protein Leryth_006160 [Lithospermum erythrorhizon]|nr:hypothetical protein Leryth_006160 [Lithospermum erythrorhizon]
MQVIDVPFFSYHSPHISTVLVLLDDVCDGYEELPEMQVACDSSLSQGMTPEEQFHQRILSKDN